MSVSFDIEAVAMWCPTCSDFRLTNFRPPGVFGCRGCGAIIAKAV